MADAFAFLSRFAPFAARNRVPGLEEALPWFGPVGLGLGLCWTFPALALPPLLAAGAESAAPHWALALLSGWLWIFLSVWTTLGLHWDGLADMGDAEGSRASGERFRQILRDSRLGAFGALRLFLVLAGQWCAVSWHAGLVFEAPDAARAVALALPLVAAPAWGRGASLLLAHAGTASGASALGARACGGAGPRVLAAYRAAGLAACAGLVLLGLPLWRAALLLAAQALLLRRLAALARREGGLSGDFFGAAIEEGTLCFLLFTL
ncbi:MAG: adenosylcobinamide-GDP ribazoletransferase [Desulfovibrio sp.]|nr:adenosylcobinamide-GDP ribazoletransferase [Desulfovibrio sp.]